MGATGLFSTGGLTLRTSYPMMIVVGGDAWARWRLSGCGQHRRELQIPPARRTKNPSGPCGYIHAKTYMTSPGAEQRLGVLSGYWVGTPSLA